MLSQFTSLFQKKITLKSETDGTPKKHVMFCKNESVVIDDLHSDSEYDDIEDDENENENECGLLRDIKGRGKPSKEADGHLKSCFWGSI